MDHIIKLVDYCGELCTTRNNQGLSELKSLLKKAIRNGDKLFLDREEVKVFSTLFVDELLCKIMLDNDISVDDLNDYIEFSPKLESIHLQQITRGIRLRK